MLKDMTSVDSFLQQDSHYMTGANCLGQDLNSWILAIGYPLSFEGVFCTLLKCSILVAFNAFINYL